MDGIFSFWTSKIYIIGMHNTKNAVPDDHHDLYLTV
jgi:hypothetical protein